MRDHILDRLAYLANLITTTAKRDRESLARAAMTIAVTHHRTCPPAEGSP